VTVGQGTRLFLGVDGGGTKTRARVRDEAGRALGEAEAGPGNFHLGEPAWREVMRASAAALAAAGIPERDFGRVTPASASPARSPPPTGGGARQAASLRVAGGRYRCLVAYLGAWGGADGAILILGTGSCGLAGWAAGASASAAGGTTSAMTAAGWRWAAWRSTARSSRSKAWPR